MTDLLLQLFGTFFLIGLFNFGGGGAMLSLIQSQVVTEHAWLSEGAFTNIVAISQSTPGPIGINCATYVGYQVMYDAGFSHAAGMLGSAAATFAVVLPSFLLFMAIVKVFEQMRKHPVFIGVMSALRPSVAGLIAAAALILMFNVSWNGMVPTISVISDNFRDWTSWALFGAAFAASYFFKANPIHVIIAAGILGLLIY